MNTIPCYDRFAPHRRWALALLLGTGLATLAAQQAQAAPLVQQLPRVLVTGKSLQTQAADAARAQARLAPRQLPRVGVVAQRPQQLAQSLPRAYDY